MYTNLPTSQGYIFRILQHFATKLCSFSNFDNFFPGISFVIPRIKIFLKRKSSIKNQTGILPVQFLRKTEQMANKLLLARYIKRYQGPVVRKVDSTIRRIAIF